MGLKHVGGKNASHVVIYALSTCPWCKKTKKLLDDLGLWISVRQGISSPCLPNMQG